jgi:hypothetical protein
MANEKFGWVNVGDYRNLNFKLSDELAAMDVDPKRVRRRSKMWSPGIPTDQGDTAHCVGFAGENWQLAAPIMDDIRVILGGHDMYAECKRFDSMPMIDGTTTNALMKALRELEMVKKWGWGYDAETVRTWVLVRGTVFIGVPWTEGMMTPDTEGYITPIGRPMGGHEVLIVGYVAPKKSFRIKNSWGEAWGERGLAWMLESNLDYLLQHGGEACGAIETRWSNEILGGKRW